MGFRGSRVQTKRIRAVRWLAVFPLFGCATPAATTSWREIAPIPNTRIFHRAGLAADGRVLVWGGNVGRNAGEPPRARSVFAIAIYDPVADAWSTGPAAPKFLTRTRVHSRRPDEKEPYADVDAPQELRSEYPAGAAARGRMYWFAGAGPVWFDPATNAWGQAEPPTRDQDERHWLAPVSRWQRHNCVTSEGPDGRLYLVGGTGYSQPYLGPEVDRRQQPREVVSLLDSLEIYDPATATWSQGAPMKRARQLFAGAFGADGMLYVFGGYAHTGGVSQRPGESDADYERRTEEMIELGRHSLTSVEAYDPKTNAWSDRAPMPEGRHAMGAALGADGRIYVVGGAVAYSSPRPTDSVFVYDPPTNTWERGPSLNHARYHHAVASSPDGKLYAIAGTNGTPSGEGGLLKSVEVLNTAESSPSDGLAPAGAASGR